MIIYTTTNIFTLALVLAIWIIDAYLILTAIRFALEYSMGTRNSSLVRWLVRVTDSLPMRLGQFISDKTRRKVHIWLPRALLLVAAVALRHVMVLLIITST